MLAAANPDVSLEATIFGLPLVVVSRLDNPELPV